MEKLRENYKNIPEVDAEFQKQLAKMERDINLIDKATDAFDVAGILVSAYGLYNQVIGEDASAEKDLVGVISKYRADIAGLRDKYVKKRDDFVGAQIKKLVQP